MAAAGSWGAVQLGGDSNWDTSQSGGVDAAVPPGANSHVHFSADGAGNFATQLLQDLTIKALTFHANSGTNGVSVGGTGILTIGNGTDTPSLDVLTGGNDSIVISTPLALGASQSWNVQDGTSVLTISGGIGGTGDLTLNDNGTATGALLFNGAASSFAGVLSVEGGKLIFEDTGSLSENSDVTLAAGTSIQAGTPTMEATPVILGGLVSVGSDGAVVGGNANPSTLIFTPVTADSSYGGAIGGAGTNENNLNIVKDGTLTQTLNGTLTYTGTTLVQQGTLQLGTNAVFTPGGH